MFLLIYCKIMKFRMELKGSNPCKSLDGRLQTLVVVWVWNLEEV